MSDTKSIYAKLSSARAEFHASSIVKTGYNKFSEYSYFEFSDFLVPAIRILAKNDLIAVISFTPDIATMTVYDMTCDATIIITSPMSTASLKACQPVQSMGACETFNRRYLYSTLMEIVEHDAVEASAGDPKNEPPSLATDEQCATIQDFLDADSTPDVTKEFIKSRMPLTEKQAATIISKLNKESK